MVLGSMVGFSEPAHAVTGELTVGPRAGNESYLDLGVIFGLEVRGGAFGSTSVTSPWTTSSLDLQEAPGNCFDVEIAIPGDSISWSGMNATEVFTAGTVFNINGDSCGFPNANCVVTLDESIALTATDWTSSPGSYTGTFRDDNMTEVGGFTISEGPGNLCRSSGLADWPIWPSLMGSFPPATALPWSGTSTNLIDVELHKTLELPPPPPPTHELVIDGTYEVLGTTTITDCDGNAGTITGSVWTGAIDCDGVNGTPGCFDQNISANDTLNWGVSPVTETLSNIVITVTAHSGCSGGAPVTCIVSLSGSRVLQSSFFPLFLGHRTGTFVEAPSTTVGAYTITDGGNCVASGYAALFTLYLGSSPSTRAFDVSWAKDLTI